MKIAKERAKDGETPHSCPGCRERNRGARQLIEPWYTDPISGETLLWQCFRCGAVMEWGGYHDTFTRNGKTETRVMRGYHVVAYRPVVLPLGIGGVEQYPHGNRKEAKNATA